MAKYGLIGKRLDYSFSKTFFTFKFEQEKRKDTYHNFEIDDIDDLPKLIEANSELRGLNVTIPYKESVIPLLDSVDKEAAEIGAVNTIRFLKDGRLKGYNTDHYGFAKSLADLLPIKERTALILGTGGASKAIHYVLDTMNFDTKVVSRKAREGQLSYDDLDRSVMGQYFLIINCTPIGTFPEVNACPNIPYHHLGSDHVLFDLVYNPKETEFMKRGFIRGARVSNGLKMLEYQAKKAWKIWRS